MSVAKKPLNTSNTEYNYYLYDYEWFLKVVKLFISRTL